MASVRTYHRLRSAVHEIRAVAAMHMDIYKTRRNESSPRINPFVHRIKTPGPRTNGDDPSTFTDNIAILQHPVGQDDNAVVKADTHNRRLT